jgi:hypothetical protein
MVGGVSTPRLICGCNSFLGYSHISAARDAHIRELFDTPSKIADVVEVFTRRGCNAFSSGPHPFIHHALDEVQQRTGTRVLWMATPDATNMDDWKRAVDQVKAWGATFCFTHQSTTDPRLDRFQQRLNPELVQFLNYVSQAGMVPGLSTHTPESMPFADATPEAGVETYIQPYNAAGFFCQVETDWLAHAIHNAKKPVTVIKPLGSGKLLPPTGLTFVWNTIRPCDMVTIGTMSAYEAEEDIELSLAILAHRKPEVQLQFTRSKKSLLPAKD